MKSLFIVTLLFIFNSISAQRLINTIAVEVCNCLAAERNKNNSQDFQTMLENCFQESMMIHSDALVEEYGEEILSDENTSVAYKFGEDLGLILSKQCDIFIEIIISQQKKDRQISDTLFKLGQEKYNEGLFDQAIEYFTKAISSEKGNHEYYNSRGLAYFSNAMYYEAISDFLKVIELSPSNYIGYYNIAYTKFQLKDYDGALKAINSSINVDRNYCLSYNLKGLINSQSGETDSSVVYFQKAYDCDSSSSVFSYNLGYGYYNLEEYDKALRWFLKSYQVDSTDLKLLSYIGNCYNNMEDYDNAIRIHSRSIIRTNSMDYVPFYNRGLSYLNIKKYDKAKSDFIFASKIDSTDSDIIFYLAFVYSRLNEDDQARITYDKLIRMEPDNPNYYDSRAAFYDKINEYELAIRDYQFSLNLYPGDCMNYQHLGKLYLKINKKDLANESFRKSVELGCKESESMIQK